MTTLVNRAAMRDRGDALDWIAEIDDDDDVRLSIVTQSSGLVQNLENPAEWIDRLPFGEAREQLAMHIAMVNFSSLEKLLSLLGELEGVDHDRLIGNTVKAAMFDFGEVLAPSIFGRICLRTPGLQLSGQRSI